MKIHSHFPSQPLLCTCEQPDDSLCFFVGALGLDGGGGRADTPVFLPGESQGRGSVVGCCLWGRTESDTTEAT